MTSHLTTAPSRQQVPHRRTPMTPTRPQTDSAPQASTAYQHAQYAPNTLTSGDIAALQRTAGNQAVHDLLQRRSAPPKRPNLRVGPVGDRYERQADRVAEQVTRGLNNDMPSVSSVATGVQRMGESSGAPMTPELSQAIQSTRGGRVLDKPVRARMEQQFGRSLADVRIHTNPRADQLNRSLDARAFTKGNDIFFRSGEYQPGTQAGDHLLAHELTHVVQQANGTVQRDVIQRVPTAVTNGGTWKANVYQTVDDGAEIELEFEPNDTVNAKKIGLIQTSLKIEKGRNYDTQARADYEAGNFQMPAQKRKAQRSEGTRHIDRHIQKNNPIYGAEDLKKGEGVSATKMGKLNVGEQAMKKGTYQNYQLGYRYKSFFGLKTNKRSAKLYDMPQLPGASAALAKNATEKSEMTFETAAVAISGAQSGTYYGSVEWGWKLDDPGTGVELINFTKKSDGNPSQEFQNTATNWNAGEFDEGFANPQIPLPPPD